MYISPEQYTCGNHFSVFRNYRTDQNNRKYLTRTPRPLILTLPGVQKSSIIDEPTVAKFVVFYSKYPDYMQPIMGGRWSSISYMTVRLMTSLVLIFPDITYGNKFLPTAPDVCTGQYHSLRSISCEDNPLYNPYNLGVLC